MAEFEQAIALDPNSFEAHYLYGRACFTQGKLERAATLFERAAEIKPDDYQALCLLIHDLSVDLDGSRIARMPRAGALNGRSVNSRFTLKIARAAYLGATALVSAWRKGPAREWLSRALAIDPDDLLTQYNVACIYSLLGDMEQAFDLLERLIPHAGQEMKQGWIKHDSDLDPLRSHPRYQKDPRDNRGIAVDALNTELIRQANGTPPDRYSCRRRGRIQPAHGRGRVRHARRTEDTADGFHRSAKSASIRDASSS